MPVRCTVLLCCTNGVQSGAAWDSTAPSNVERHAVHPRPRSSPPQGRLRGLPDAVLVHGVSPPGQGDDERLGRVRAAPAELTAASSQCPWKGTRSTLWPRTQTVAAVLLLIRRTQRLKKTETPQKKPPKVHGLNPTISRRSQRL